MGQYVRMPVAISSKRKGDGSAQILPPAFLECSVEARRRWPSKYVAEARRRSAPPNGRRLESSGPVEHLVRPHGDLVLLRRHRDGEVSRRRRPPHRPTCRRLARDLTASTSVVRNPSNTDVAHDPPDAVDGFGSTRLCAQVSDRPGAPGSGLRPALPARAPRRLRRVGAGELIAKNYSTALRLGRGDGQPHFCADRSLGGHRLEDDLHES